MSLKSNQINNDVSAYSFQINDTAKTFLTSQLNEHGAIKVYSEMNLMFNKKLYTDEDNSENDVSYMKMRCVNSGTRFISTLDGIDEFLNFEQENTSSRVESFTSDGSNYKFGDVRDQLIWE